MAPKVYKAISKIFIQILLLTLITQINSEYVRISSYDLMKCSYGERGSLTATCVNATSTYFKNTPYRFDHLDETLRCVNCSLQIIDSGTFDISGNQIKNLDLSNCLINTIRQRAFVGLIFLEQLILSNNNVKSIYPGTFTGVKKISYVNLENNSISVLAEDGFLELIDLRKLNLRNNQIKTIVPRAFNGLQNLNILDLSNNEINDIKDIFNNLTSLQVLNLNNNKITVLNGNEFNNLTSLLEITFSNNKIKFVPLLEFVELSSLRKLDLSFNLIDRVVAGSFQGLYLLEDLDLSNNNIAEVPQKTLQSLHSLRNLNISNNIISIFQTGLYSGLPQLRTLNLSRNFIEEIEITGVFSLHSLHTLDLSNNNVTDLDYIALISRLPRISYLKLENNLLPCDLEKEMEQYFSEDNFKFVLYQNEVGSIKCVDYPNNNKISNATYTVDSLKRHMQEEHDHGSNVWIVTLICVTLVLVSILYYLQFRTYRELRGGSFKRATSEVQLISSDLEARDNDYLKE